MLKPPIEDISPNSLQPLKKEMAYLQLAEEQRKFAVQTREASLPFLMDSAAKEEGGFLGAQFYRDAQWLDFNVLLFQLERVIELYKLDAFENVELAKVEISGLCKRMGTLLGKLWIMQDGLNLILIFYLIWV